MIIKALKSFSDGVISMHEGEVAKVPDAKATVYIADGYAVEYTGDAGVDLTDYAKLEDLADYAKTEDLVTYSPDDKGAVGDGETIDDDAFLEGNYCYQLTKGKVYRVSINKLRAIYGNSCVGDGVIRYIAPAYYNTHAYQVGNSSNTTVIPTYGAGNHVVEMSARSKKNRLLECINHISNTLSTNTDGSTSTSNHWYRMQSAGLEVGKAYTYRGIGAVQRATELAETLPDTFTLCLGKCKVLTRKRGGTEWIKTIDELPADIKNFGMPWLATDSSMASEERARAFTNRIEVVDDHLELVINKNEINAWAGSVGNFEFANVHFWTNDYSASTDEFYDAIICQSAWIKEPEASNKLLYTLGIDCFRDYHTDVHKYEDYKQIIIDVQKELTTEPQTFYGCTMDVDGALAVDFNAISALADDTKMTTMSNKANYNVLGFDDDFSVTQGAYTLAYNKDDDYFTLSIDENETTSWTTIDLSSHLASALPIKNGDKFRFYVEPLDESSDANIYQGTFYYASSKAISSNATHPVNGVYSKVTTAEADSTGFLFGTSVATVKYSKFRVWLTMGELDKGYQKYGESVKCLFERNNVINEVTEEKISNLNAKITALVARVEALENPTT